MMWDYGDHMSGWGWAVMAFGSVLFWALIVVGVIALVRYLGRERDRSQPVGPTAEELLAQRFARGEIDEAEYRHRLDVLRQRIPTTVR